MLIAQLLMTRRPNENECLTIDLDKGEPYKMVNNGLSQAGHDIKIILDVDPLSMM